jgi:hypothetical protein
MGDRGLRYDCLSILFDLVVDWNKQHHRKHSNSSNTVKNEEQTIEN